MHLFADAGNTATGVFPHKESADRGADRRSLEDRTPQSRSRGKVRDRNESVNNHSRSLSLINSTQLCIDDL